MTLLNYKKYSITKQRNNKNQITQHHTFSIQPLKLVWTSAEIGMSEKEFIPPIKSGCLSFSIWNAPFDLPTTGSSISSDIFPVFPFLLIMIWCHVPKLTFLRLLKENTQWRMYDSNKGGHLFEFMIKFLTQYKIFLAAYAGFAL